MALIAMMFTAQLPEQQHKYQDSSITTRIAAQLSHNGIVSKHSDIHMVSPLLSSHSYGTTHNYYKINSSSLPKQPGHIIYR
jgi:hypothetical protein